MNVSVRNNKVNGAGFCELWYERKVVEVLNNKRGTMRKKIKQRKTLFRDNVIKWTRREKEEMKKTESPVTR